MSGPAGEPGLSAPPPAPAPPEEAAPAPRLDERALARKRRAPLVLLAIAIALVVAAEPIRRSRAFEAGLWLEGWAAAFAIAAALLGDPRTRRWLLYATVVGGFVQVGAVVLGWISPWRGLDDLGMGFYCGAFVAYFLARRLDPHWAALADRLGAESSAAVFAARAKKHEESAKKHEESRAAWAAKQREYAAKQGKYAEERARRAADQGK